MLDALAAEASIDTAEINVLCITGNTTMLYLLTASDPTALSRAPFAADRLFTPLADTPDTTPPAVTDTVPGTSVPSVTDGSVQNGLDAVHVGCKRSDDDPLVAVTELTI